MIKRVGLLSGLGMLLLISCAATKQIPQANPNIIFILADDLGYGDISAYNKDSKIITKSIDKLATEGVLFTDAHTSSSVCTPTRYGILTGRYNWRTTLKKGVINGYSKALIPANRKTIAGFLKDNGYKTAGIGKWHLGWDWNNIDAGKELVNFSEKITNGPTERGFDYWYGFNGSLDMAPYVWVENDEPTMVPHKITSNAGQKKWRKGLNSDDFEHEQVLPSITKKTVDFINENAHKGQPFFVYMPLPAPHTPILPTKAFQGKSGLENPYGDFVLMVDDVVGQVMEALETQGIAENTILIFTSDNGCSNTANFKQLATKGHDPSYVFRGHKADIFEGGHRVPFIVRWPSKVQPSKTDQLICTTDFFCTIADALNLTGGIREDMAEDSYSFLSAMNIPSNLPVRTSIVHHSINGSFAYRKGDYKTIFCPGSGGWSKPRPKAAKAAKLPKIQLYNLVSDIGETNNLFATQAEVAEQHQQDLTKIIMDGRSAKGLSQQNDGLNYGGLLLMSSFFLIIY